MTEGYKALVRLGNDWDRSANCCVSETEEYNIIEKELDFLNSLRRQLGYKLDYDFFDASKVIGMWVNFNGTAVEYLGAGTARFDEMKRFLDT